MIIIDVPRNTIQRDGKEIKCYSPQQFSLLVHLALANGVVKSRSDIIRNCFKSKVVGERNVDQAVLKIRKMINDPYPGKIIECIHQSGFRIMPGKVKVIGQDVSKTLDGYVFLKFAKMKGGKEPFVVLQSIKDINEWIIVPRSEYESAK